jgi:hypothetical protein
MLKSLLPLLAALSLTTATSAQIIVNTGDDLAALAATAATGSVLQINSDATFVGTLDWVGKSLTFTAGPGYSPVIRGSVNNLACLLLPNNPPTKATFVGLRIEGGDPPPGSSALPGAFFLQAWGGATLSSELILLDCTVKGVLTAGGTGLSTGAGTFKNTVFEDNLNLYGFFTGTLPLLFEACVIKGPVGAICLPFSGNQRQMDFTAQRCRFEGEVGFNASGGSTLNVTMDSCIVERDNLTAAPFYGIRCYSDAAGTITNTTVTGAFTGIKGVPTMSWHNMLLFGNGADLENVSSGEIASSVISDGTFDGLNGNLGGPVVVDANLALVACSAGIDSGDNLAPGLGSLDYFGNPRIQDNDFDLALVVNAGAVESTGSIAGSKVIENGNGVNPMGYLAITLPTVGTNYQAFLPPSPATIATLVVIDAPSPPVTSTAFVGELMLMLSGGAYYDFSLGPHIFPIPLDCSFIGLQVSTQGFRIHSFFGVVSTYCLNRIDLTIGG